MANKLHHPEQNQQPFSKVMACSSKDEEDEWEYEYSTTETESFYIPIDVSNVPELQASSKNTQSQKLGHPWLLKTKLRAFYANRKEAENAAAHNATLNATADVPEGEGEGLGAPATMGEIQAVGLHTENPLIMYNGQLLSCQWVSALGTDLMFAKPEAEKEVEDGEANAETEVQAINGEKDGEKPLRTLPEVDLIAVGSARLVARVARLRPKDELFEGTSKDRADEEMRTDEHADGTASSETVPRQTTNDTVMAGTEEQHAKPTPSSFLERLNAAKAKRGENSRLVLSGSAGGSRLVAEEVNVEQSSKGVEETEDVTMTGT